MTVTKLNKTDMHEYQNTAVKHILDNTHCALFLEMGLGKTVATLTAIEFLMYQDLDISKVLVIAPKRVAESVWDAECKKWSHISKLKVVKVIGLVKQRKKALASRGDIYMIGRDNIAWLCGQYGGSMLPFDMWVIDEMSSFKNNKSIRFKALRKVQPSAKRIVGLTGTPAPNGLLDLWSQIYLLDRGKRLGKFITAFRRDFFDQSWSGYSFSIKGEKASNKIHKKIGDICMSMKAKDYLELPGQIYNIIELSMSDVLKQKYKIFEKEKVLQLFEEQDDDKDISAVNAAVLSNKLLQFANGAVYDEDKNYHTIHNDKIHAVIEIIEEAGGKPVLIAWTYRSDMYRLKKALKKYEPVELKTDDDIKNWNKGKIHVLMMHPASGGHGLNLQDGGNNIIWFGQTWSLELYQQLNARLHRQGQQNVVIIHKLVMKGTIDEDVIKAQERKAKGQDGLMEAVKARIKKYITNV